MPYCGTRVPFSVDLSIVTPAFPTPPYMPRPRQTGQLMPTIVTTFLGVNIYKIGMKQYTKVNCSFFKRIGRSSEVHDDLEKVGRNLTHLSVLLDTSNHDLQLNCIQTEANFFSISLWLFHISDHANKRNNKTGIAKKDYRT